MSLAIIFSFLCAQPVSDIDISIIRSLRLFCWITPLVVCYGSMCVGVSVLLGWRCICVAGWISLQNKFILWYSWLWHHAVWYVYSGGSMEKIATKLWSNRNVKYTSARSYLTKAMTSKIYGEQLQKENFSAVLWSRRRFAYYIELTKNPPEDY